MTDEGEWVGHARITSSVFVVRVIRLALRRSPLFVVCIAAHPDDIEIGCGGTLLQLSKRGGVAGAWLTLTGDDDRQAEARAAARSFLSESTSTFVGLPDGRLPGMWNAVKDALHDFGRSVPVPDVVFAPRDDDAHQDHRLLGSMVSTVWRDSLILHYEIPKWDGDFGRPSFYVPLDEQVANRKIELLDSHFPSQRERDWWRPEFFRSLMTLRGAECRARFAESFTVNKCMLDTADW